MSNVHEPDLCAASADAGWSDILDALEKRAPEFIFRKDIARYTGGLLKNRTCANYDCAGTGIENRCCVNKVVAYPRCEVFAFLRSRITVPPAKGRPNSSVSALKRMGKADTPPPSSVRHHIPPDPIYPDTRQRPPHH